MPLPPNTHHFTRPLDPYDIEVYVADLKRGLDADALLGPNESVDEFTLSLHPEAVLAGLIIATDEGRATTISGAQLRLWLKVDSAMIGNPLFAGSGVTLGLELRVSTNASPARRKRRTLSVQVAFQ